MLRNCLSKLNAPAFVRFASGTAARNPETVTVATPRVEKSLNQVVLLGRVGTEPQMRGTEEHPVVVFTMATHTNFKQQAGDVQQRTDWHRISVFRPFLRDSVYKYMNKGQRVLVQGKILYGQVKDAAGTVHTTTTISADDVIFFNKADVAVVDEDDNTFA